MVKTSTVVAGAAAVGATVVAAYIILTRAGPGGGGGGATTFSVKVVDANTGSPIPGASVTYNAQTKTSGSDGLVSFSAVPGFTPLDVTAAGYQELLEPNFQGVNGQAYTAAMLSLTTANIVIKAEDISGLIPIQGVSIAVDGHSGVTDATGSVGFNGLTPGTYTVTASKSGYSTTTQQIQVNPGGGTFTIFMTTLGGPLWATVVSPANSSTFAAGQNVTFQGSAAGGTGPYTYRWFFPDGVILNGQSVTRSFSAGNWDAQLNVIDSAGHDANAYVTFSVQ